MTEDWQANNLKLEFRQRRRRQVMLSWIIVPLAIAAYAWFKMPMRFVWLAPFLPIIKPLFCVVIIVALIYSYRNWRCPACGRSLSHSLSTDRCYKCGTEFK